MTSPKPAEAGTDEQEAQAILDNCELHPDSCAYDDNDLVKHIAAALRAARRDEREACAKIADSTHFGRCVGECECNAEEIAARIRERGEG